ncbi:MAG TPA: branched-chain amino acid transaminase [Candidatus Dormibacteraeota bacterium]|nr:branched-chain amino acid transaminase [Candidatus Dormibacteraeota bacterium]
MTQSAPTVPHTVPSRDESWVYYDGEIRRYADSRLGLMTHALHYGTGCFEGIRAYWVEEQQQLFAFRMPEHYERLRDSAKILLMDLPLSTEELCAVTSELLRRNGWRQDVYIRPLVYKSSEEIGVRLHGLKDGFLVFTAPFGAYVDIDAGIRCMVSSWRRIDDNVAPARSKCTGIYVNSALAKTEAMQNGFDEAIMLTHEGHVCEGSAENIFIVRNGTLITPPESDNILEGITRATLIHLAAEEMGLEVLQRCIDRSELYIADEVFLCGTGAQVSPVIEIDRRRIGDGEPGPLTSRIQSDYFALCKGRNPKYRDWLTAVY